MTISARGRSTAIVFVIFEVAVSMIDTRLSAYSATNNFLPVGDSARPAGSAPTSIVASIAGVPPSMPVTRTTVPSARFATNAVLLSAAITTLDGVPPVATRESRVLSAVANTDSVPSSGFTIATSVPSSDSAIVLERDGFCSTGPSGGWSSPAGTGSHALAPIASDAATANVSFV